MGWIGESAQTQTHKISHKTLFHKILSTEPATDRWKTMCFVCDRIVEPCGWQRAKDLSDYFAGWEATPCHMCDDEFDEFVSELGLNPQQTCSRTSQQGDLEATLEERQHASEEAPGRPPPRERSLAPGMTTPRIGVACRLSSCEFWTVKLT